MIDILLVLQNKITKEEVEGRRGGGGGRDGLVLGLRQALSSSVSTVEARWVQQKIGLGLGVGLARGTHTLFFKSYFRNSHSMSTFTVSMCPPLTAYISGVQP